VREPISSISPGHPCYDEKAHFRVGRLHLPVAPKCNIKCRYCARSLESNEERPGVSYGILSPGQALEAAKKVISEDESIRVIAVAGPGDPLANQETLETLELVHHEFPHLMKCLATNGLLLPSVVSDLVSVGVTHITVTVNAVDREVGKCFYSWARFKERTYREDAFDILSPQQLQGIRMASQKGMRVKVNTVLVSELNLNHLPEVARKIKEHGASIMNIMPLIPVGEMSHFHSPSCSEIREARERCENIIEVFRLCKHCRADAVGIPGREGGNRPLLGRLGPCLGSSLPYNCQYS
jgi:nitrogen fixation protein NifB